MCLDSSMGGSERGDRVRAFLALPLPDEQRSLLGAHVEECARRAHVALARARPAPSRLPELPAPPALEPWKVGQFVLYESRLGGPSATYLELARFGLEPPGAAPSSRGGS